MFTAQDVKALRDLTGAGMMDCKKALAEAGGDSERAQKVLREKGLAAAQKKSGRIAAEGIVESYIHMGGKIGVLVEVNCETDFVAKTDEFRAFVRNVAMQIAASNPKYVSVDEVPPDLVEEEKRILKVQVMNEGKPEKIAEKMIEGRIKKFLKDICLLEQPYIRDPDKTVWDIVTEQIARIGENISVRRFARFQMGEELEKRADNFAQEVMSQIK